MILIIRKTSLWRFACRTAFYYSRYILQFLSQHFTTDSGEVCTQFYQNIHAYFTSIMQSFIVRHSLVDMNEMLMKINATRTKAWIHMYKHTYSQHTFIYIFKYYYILVSVVVSVAFLPVRSRQLRYRRLVCPLWSPPTLICSKHHTYLI